MKRGESCVSGKGKHPVNGDGEECLILTAAKIDFSTNTNLSIVMAGFIPAIHVFKIDPRKRRGWPGQARP
jgi:hypothetical protein